jgi:hypothetical protein
MSDNNRNTEQSVKYIISMELDPIINNLVINMGWIKSDAIEIADMYRKFLFLKAKYGHEYNLPPSDEIDEFWHMHILDTMKYRNDCEAIFGYYLDHYPYFGIDGNTDLKDLNEAFEKTQELFALEFDGQGIYRVRGLYSKIISLIHKIRKKI